MIDELRAMAVFAKTVETGSFRSAAHELNLSPSVVSHHVSQLESRLGVALLYRSTRKLSLTSEGQTLFASAKAMLEAAAEGLNALSRQSPEPSGQLALSIPAFFATSPLLASIAIFARKHPKVALSIRFSDHREDLIENGIDLVVRIGPLKDCALKSVRFHDMERVLVASPAHIAAHPPAQTPEDLKDWDWIGLRMRPYSKLLTHRDGSSFMADYTPRIVVDSVEAACQLAVAGLGLASPPRFLAASALDCGQLIEVLPNWKVDALGVYALWPANAPREGLTMRLVDFLREASVAALPAQTNCPTDVNGLHLK